VKEGKPYPGQNVRKPQKDYENSIKTHQKVRIEGNKNKKIPARVGGGGVQRGAGKREVKRVDSQKERRVKK